MNILYRYDKIKRETVESVAYFIISNCDTSIVVGGRASLNQGT